VSTLEALERRARGVRRLYWAPLLLACSGLSCGGRAEGGPQPSAAPAPAPQPAAAAQPLQQERKYEPPRLEFKAPVAWQSRKSGTPPIPPPDPSAEVWRVFVTQNEPLQIKTPKWQSLPPQENVEVAMPEGSSFRCMVSPLEIATDTNDFNTKLKAWVLKRVLTCSDDGWRNWTEYSHSVRVTPEGQRDMLAVPEALLRERMPDQSIKQSFVLLRSDKEIREATTGPPRILYDRVVDED
jgi:hypothetical protein